MSEALKSTPITNLDTIPVVPNTTGEGAPGMLRSVNAHVAASATAASGSTYRLVRIPVNAKVKQVLLTSVAQGGSAAVDVDVAYSDSTIDGTNPANQGNIIQVSAADNKLFGSAVSLVSAVKNDDVTFSNTFTTAEQNEPLWEVLGLTSDPGGMFDILLKATAELVNGGDVAIEVRYVD